MQTADAAQAQTSRAQVAFTCEGTPGAPTRGMLDAAFSPAGARSFAVEAEFAPRAGFAEPLPGRNESFGTMLARLRSAARVVEIEGPAPWHEQPQTDPCFVVPFTCASLWGITLGRWRVSDAARNAAGFGRLCDLRWQGGNVPLGPRRSARPDARRDGHRPGRRGANICASRVEAVLD